MVFFNVQIVLILYWRPKDYTIGHCLSKLFGLLHELCKIQTPKGRERERKKESKGEKYLLVVLSGV
jgi:hypothetical protein